MNVRLHDRKALIRVRGKFRFEETNRLHRSVKDSICRRAENRDVAAEMDKGTPIAGRIGRMADNPNPWKRLRVDVFVGL